MYCYYDNGDQQFGTGQRLQQNISSKITVYIPFLLILKTFAIRPKYSLRENTILLSCRFYRHSRLVSGSLDLNEIIDISSVKKDGDTNTLYLKILDSWKTPNKPQNLLKYKEDRYTTVYT